MMQLLWTGPAINDRQCIFDFVGICGAAAAVKLDERICACASQLATHPRMGRRGRARGTRELVVDSQYVLVYETGIIDDSVVILRVLHARRQWPAK